LHNFFVFIANPAVYQVAKHGNTTNTTQHNKPCTLHPSPPAAQGKENPANTPKRRQRGLQGQLISVQPHLLSVLSLAKKHLIETI